jgi:hypothetical protein
VAQKYPRRRGGVECHSDVDFKPSNTPNGTGTAKNADMELKIKAFIRPHKLSSGKVP